MKQTRYALLAAFAIALGLAGCNNPTSTPTTTTAKTYVYAVDTYNGHVYQIDPATKIAASSPIATIGQNSSGEIRFGAGKAFVAVGSGGNNKPGLYYFDPSSSSPVAIRIGEAISAQYIYIASATRGYVTSADYTSTLLNALYGFNPSSPSSGLTKIAELSYPQDIAADSAGVIYVAENYGKKVARLNSAGTALDIEIATSAEGPTGLLAGTYEGKAGIFVADTGCSSSYVQGDGALDFIPSDATSSTKASAVLPFAKTGIGRLAAFDATSIVATNYGKTYIIDTASKSKTEIKSGTKAFGSLDVDVYGGYAYIPTYDYLAKTSVIYSFSSAGTSSVSTIAVGADGTDGICNVGVGTIEE